MNMIMKTFYFDLFYEPSHQWPGNVMFLFYTSSIMYYSNSTKQTP